jgi:predicted metal-dependent peptidase
MVPIEKQVLEARKALQLIRLGAFEIYPSIATAIFSCKLIVTPGLKEKSGFSWCVDEFYRVYVDPLVLVGPEMETVLESIASLLHEVQHPLRNHFQRFRAMSEGSSEPLSMRNANLAADMALNSQSFLRNNLPKNCIFPSTFPSKSGYPLPWGETTEYYYENAQFPPEEEGGGGPGEGKGEGKGGDAAGGERSWELGPPTDENPGCNEEEVQDIQEATAKEIQAQEKIRPGSQPGDLVEWAGEILEPPKVDWRQVFSQLLREARDYSVGASAQTFSKTNRRMAAIMDDIVLPALYEPNLHPALVVDSSGSMSDEDLNDCFSEIGEVLRTAASETFVVTGDVKVDFAEYVHNVESIEIKSRGGTNMRPLFQRAVEESPHCVVVMTDGYFTFPPEKELNGIPLIVCLIGNSTRSYCPEWVQVVEVNED